MSEVSIMSGYNFEPKDPLNDYLTDIQNNLLRVSGVTEVELEDIYDEEILFYVWVPRPRFEE